MRVLASTITFTVAATCLRASSASHQGDLLQGRNTHWESRLGATYSALSDKDQRTRAEIAHSLSMVLGVLATIQNDNGEGRDSHPYDFRESAAYAALSDKDRQSLEQVTRDLMTIWGALDLYADYHADEPPEKLDALVPLYLKELPRDPFATEATAAEAEPRGGDPSLGGWGYRYRRGAPGNRAWVISSAGLPEFPYLSDTGNIGLYRCKGTWISGRNPMIIKGDDHADQ